jgi:high-affinity nickel-transport protein
MQMLPVLALGFLLGMRHATDSDHVVAITTIVSREKTVRAASVIGALWGAGHSAAILLVGGAIVLFGVVMPARVGLVLELAVALMLVLLGVLNVVGVRRAGAHDDHRSVTRRARFGAIRPLAVGIVHGLAGSAAVALFVLTTIREPLYALAYLLLFGVGTLAGMMLITSALALPLAVAARKLTSFTGHIGVVTGLFSVATGLFLTYQIGFVGGLFRSGLALPLQ